MTDSKKDFRIRILCSVSTGVLDFLRHVEVTKGVRNRFKRKWRIRFLTPLFSPPRSMSNAPKETDAGACTDRRLVGRSPWLRHNAVKRLRDAKEDDRWPGTELMHAPLAMALYGLGQDELASQEAHKGEAHKGSGLF
jgi:hypothetical protein